MFGTFLVLTYHYQRVMGLSPLQTGLAFVPMTVAVAATSYGFSGRVVGRVGPRTLVVPGLVVSGAGLALLSMLSPSSGYLTTILPAEVIAGGGMGCVVSPAVSVATDAVDPRYAGVAAAVLARPIAAGAGRTDAASRRNSG